MSNALPTALQQCVTVAVPRATLPGPAPRLLCRRLTVSDLGRATAEKKVSLFLEISSQLPGSLTTPVPSSMPCMYFSWSAAAGGEGWAVDQCLQRRQADGGAASSATCDTRHASPSPAPPPALTGVTTLVQPQLGAKDAATTLAILCPHELELQGGWAME